MMECGRSSESYKRNDLIFILLYIYIYTNDLMLPSKVGLKTVLTNKVVTSSRCGFLYSG